MLIAHHQPAVKIRADPGRLHHVSSSSTMYRGGGAGGAHEQHFVHQPLLGRLALRVRKPYALDATDECFCCSARRDSPAEPKSKAGAEDQTFAGLADPLWTASAVAYSKDAAAIQELRRKRIKKPTEE